MSLRPIRASYYNTPFSLPLTYRAGVVVNLFEALESRNTIHSILLAADITQTSDNPEEFQVGTEYGWSQTLFLRAGYIVNAAEPGLNLGFGVQWQSSSWKLNADYAYADLGRFSAGHRIGLSFEL